MIHTTHEGELFRPGLNIGWSSFMKRPWIRVVWRSDNREYSSIYGVRLRFFKYPFVIWYSSTWNTVAAYLRERGLVVLTKGQYEDMLNFIPEEHDKCMFVPQEII